jgi:hypothetical protein
LKAFAHYSTRAALSACLGAAIILATVAPAARAQTETAKQQPAAADTAPKPADAARPAQPAANPALTRQPGALLNAKPGQAVRPAPGQTPVVKSGIEPPKPTVQLKPGEVPAIEFDTPIYDFGRVRAGTEITHDFWFSNTGNGPLEILQVKPS